MRYLYYLLNAETKCLYTQNTCCITSCSDSDSTDNQIGIIGKPLSNFDTTSLTELEKEDDDDDDNDDGLEVSAQSYRTR